MSENGNHQHDDTYDHNHTLNQIRVGGGNVAACHKVYGGQNSDTHHPDPGGNIREYCTEQRTQALLNRCGVMNEKYKDDHRCQDLHALGIVAFFKVVRHGSGIQLLGHLSGTVGKQQPGQQATQNCVAYTDPDGTDADVPAVLLSYSSFTPKA